MKWTKEKSLVWFHSLPDDVRCENCIVNPRENAIKAIILVYVLGTYTSQTLPPHRTNS